MARPRAAAARRTFTTPALLLRSVAYGESDLVLTMFTEQLGRISLLARAARRSRKRFAGSLEPMHTLRLELREPAGELYTLSGAQLTKPRTRLTADLSRMEAAGRALGWLRKCAPAHKAEPALWHLINQLLDALDVAAPTASPARLLVEFGLLLLTDLGWGLELERCVRCGRDCAPKRAAQVDPVRGGLVCRSCGGARISLGGAARERMLELGRGRGELLEEDTRVGLALVEAALLSHAGVE